MSRPLRIGVEVRRGVASVLLLATLPHPLAAQPPGPEQARGAAIPFAPPLDQRLRLNIESVRNGLRGEPVVFRSHYDVVLSQAGRGLVADLTLRKTTSSVKGGELLFAAILGPLLDRPARFLIGDGGRTITMLEADAYWNGFAANTPADAREPAEAARAAVAAIARHDGGRERMLSSPLQALFWLSGWSDMATQPDFRLVSRDGERIVWEQVTRSPADEALVLTSISQWTIDARTGLTTEQRQETHRGGADGPVIARQIITVAPATEP